VIPVTLAELVALLDAHVVPGSDGPAPDRPLLSVMTDSRVPAADPAVFFALATERADGHDHVAAAALAGARIAVVQRAVEGVGIDQLVVEDTWRAIGSLGRHVVDASACRVVAITGSYGKTTVKDLSAGALSASRRAMASRGSFNNELGVPLTMLSVERTTDVLVAEAGARNAGDMALLGRLLRPDVSVVTAVGPVHLETFGDEEGVASEKSRLVAALRPGGTAVLNADDPRVAAMASLAPTVLTVSATGAPADLRAIDVVVGDDGRVRAPVETPWGRTEIAPPLPGVHHLTNALLALAVAGNEGVAVDAAAAALAAAPTSPSRSVLHRVGGVAVLDDAYNASPPTMRGALGTLASIPCEGRRWAVLGVMAELGETSRSEHVALGRSCADLVDELVVVGASAEGIAEGARAGGSSLRVRMVPDHESAAALVAAEIAPGDAVLFKASRVATLDRAASSLMAALEGADVA